MTSYDLGVAPSFEYGGYSWMDIQYDAAGKTITDSIDGKMDDAEKRLKNVDIYIYEVRTDGTMVPAYDKNGNEISTKNKTLFVQTVMDISVQRYIHTEAT